MRSVPYRHPEMHMSNRTAKFLSAVFASFLAGISLATISSHSAARAADDCLSGPKQQTRQGGHWYYRIDHATKRHCWYLGDEREKLSQASRPTSPPSAKPVSPKPEPAMQRSVADAHAELTPQTRIEQPNRVDALAPAIAVDAAIGESNGAAAALEIQRSIVASRWPDQSNANPNPPADPASNPTPTERDSDTPIDSASQTEPPVLVAGQFVAADASSETPTYSVQIQLATLMGALALAGIIGSVAFKFANARRPAKARVRARRGAIWEKAYHDSGVASAYPAADAVARRPDFARASSRASDPDDRIEEFFAQLSKRTPT
jgi:hypothetical protein